MKIRDLFRRNRTKRTVRDTRWKTLLWATIAALICGAINFGEPVEKLMRIARNNVRSQAASGDIVFVGIDDKSVEALGQWPWLRRYHGKLLDRLMVEGADRVFFDYNLSQSSNEFDDKQFDGALVRSKGKAVIATRFVIDPETGKRIDTEILPRFSKHVTLGNINARRDGFGHVWHLPYGMKIKSIYYRSFASLLAHRETRSEQMFPIDYSIQFKSVPSYSALDVLKGSVPRKAFSNKQVIIALASDRQGDTYILPGQGLAAGAYIQVIGAETLKHGTPIDINWIFPFALGLLIAAAYLAYDRRWQATVLGVGGVVAFVVGPLLLEYRLIFITEFPGMLLFATVLAAQTWRRLKDRSALTNPFSGLPNLNSLRKYHASSAVGVPLIAARVQNYAEITAALPSDAEEALLAEIARRFELGIGGAALFHGDGGVFAWLGRTASSDMIGDEIEGLHALLTTPVVIAERQIDLRVTFGADAGDNRQIANRISSALLAADEAAIGGLKWKAYDSARLQDAEWKLSLLGRLDSAIDTGEIWVAYQPKLNLRTNEIVGAEALVRWTHPEKGPIPPDQFILVAELHNRIEKLTSHVLHEAIKAAAAINSHGIEFNIAVNLSARLLESPHLADLVLDVLSAHNLPPERLTVEVTESAAITDSAHSVATLAELRAAGIGVSIDDYGTGFSTLDYLRTIPATEIKIDKSFVAAMDRSQSDRLMVNSTIQLAHSLGRTVVAEGVETQTILRALTEMGCDKAQGYLISRPVKLIRLSRILLTERRKLVA